LSLNYFKPTFMKFVDIKNDIAFRKIFGNENKKEILISFLNAVLKLEKGNRIKKVKLINPYQFPRIKGQKATIIDVKAQDENHHTYIIEMQVTEKECLDKRIQYYAAKGYVNQIDKGDDYTKLKGMIFIGILNFKYFAGTKYLSRHLILDAETHENKLKDFEFNFIELPKFKKKKVEDLETVIEKWTYFIKNAKKLTVIPENTDDEGLKEAYIEADRHNWTKEELEEYEYAEMREQDERGQIELAVKRAVEKTKEEEKIETIKEAIELGLTNESISKLTKLSIEKVIEIINELKKK